MRFHERFELPIDLAQTKVRFLNRVSDLIFLDLFYKITEKERIGIMKAVAYEFGMAYTPSYKFRDYIGKDFYKCLQALEAFYKTTLTSRAVLDSTISRIVADSELDLGIRWGNGQFIRTGAKLLDEKLVNDSLRWLSHKNYQSVLEPYSKGLEHFLQSEKRPQLLSDVITDMYESLEALAKIITGRETKDLSANAQLFLKKVGASDAYKSILKEYISYANLFRHGMAENTKKPSLTHPEVESFIYLTGVFIRLVIQQGEAIGPPQAV